MFAKNIKPIKGSIAMFRSLLKKLGYVVGLIITSWLAGCTYTSYTTATTASTPASTPTKIALLLPLQGGNAASGQAVRNGFMAAYDYAKQKQTDAPAVEVIDTSSGNIVNKYQQAVAGGANFVVGPLTKPEVQALASQSRLPVPTLALNTLDNPNIRIANLYQFGLSPQEEAVQAAIRAKQDGHQRALIIVPAGGWGQRIGQAFQQQWTSVGGIVVGSYAYPSKGDVSSSIRRALHASSMPKSSASGRNAPRVTVSGRQDFDVIFLAAFPQQARQIKPSLAFYNAGRIPVYSTSLIYSGMPSPQLDADLNGIAFDDMPWIIGPETPQWNEIRDRVRMQWGSSYERSPRLYALGVDAYHLTYRMQQMSTLNGATGTLSVDPNQHIRRQLKWARIENGVPELIH